MTDAPLFTDDHLLGGRVLLRQPVNGYRVAIDPVLLAAAVQAPSGAKVLDAGCGTGAAMFCLAARRADLVITGLERSTASVALAHDALTLNTFAGNVTLIEGDLARPPAGLANTFDIVMTNPPFGADGTVSPDAHRATAHHESDMDITAWIKASLKCLRPQGRLVIIHRADRLSDMLAALRGPAGDIRILPIHPKAGEPARRVIVDAGKGRKSPDTLMPGLVLHKADGRYTPSAEAILRDAAPLIS